IAVAVAMQESSLTNTPGGDQDSVGLFQQRPSQGWGTPAQLMDPIYASTQFYTALLQVPHWQDLPLTVAAQAVQRSAFPDAYAKHEPDALAIVSKVSGIAKAALAACGAAGPWTQPVHGPIVSGFRTPNGPPTKATTSVHQPAPPSWPPPQAPSPSSPAKPSPPTAATTAATAT